MKASELPAGWAWATLDDVGARGFASITDGPFGSNLKIEHYVAAGPRVLRLQNIGDGHFTDERAHITQAHFESLRKHEVLSGDVLIAMLGETLPRSCVAPSNLGSAIVKADCVRARTDSTIASGAYVSLALNSHQTRRRAAAIVHGVGRPRLNLGEIRSLPFPLAPRTEQDRIVAAVEQHFSDIDAGVAGVERALANLKRYRASVLKAACEGRLVPTEAELARKEGRDYEPADVLLRRILKERRARWEADHLAKMKARGHAPKDDKWKANYEEPEPPEATVLSGPPEGWRWTNLGALLTAIEAGSSFKCDEREPADDEIGVVKVSAVTWGEYDERESKTCLDSSRVDPSLFVSPGEFLFSRANTIELVGACVIAKRVTRSIMLSDKILRFRLALVAPEWVLHVLRSRLGRDEIERLATGNQESMRNIGQERIRQIRIPLPPLAEQHRIVAEIDRLLSTTDETEQALRAQLARAARLRQAVLKRAFEGKLVPQDPTDEPASALLARLRSQKPADPKRTLRGKQR